MRFYCNWLRRLFQFWQNASCKAPVMTKIVNNPGEWERKSNISVMSRILLSTVDDTVRRNTVPHIKRLFKNDLYKMYNYYLYLLVKHFRHMPVICYHYTENAIRLGLLLLSYYVFSGIFIFNLYRFRGLPLTFSFQWLYIKAFPAWYFTHSYSTSH